MPYIKVRTIFFVGAYEKKVTAILSELERRSAENEISANPWRWPIIPGTGGVRKARVRRGNRGRSGGVRIAYFFWPSKETIFFLSAYAKNEKSDLSGRDKKDLKVIVKLLIGGRDG